MRRSEAPRPFSQRTEDKEKAADLPTDLDFGTVQRIGLDAGLVDNKSASITETFQGLQFVYRLKDRPR